MIFGTDVFAAVVQRSALQAVDDAALTAAMGHAHRVADKRFPPIGITGLVSAVLVAVVAAASGNVVAATAASIAVLALVVWLGIFAKISLPVNKQLVDAAQRGRAHPNARVLQATWDGVINVRVALQATALVALCVVLAVA
ncbi:DUF1772 domain-containing protein [Antrihabitans cavernicola]|uniref:DUF1772 domain-containing protein n=1 Tax=Antrihabitans cavernicola TaxID=2495913 RepID=UPI001BE4CFFE|nr:DUF1772 domain-containing protein [Spelaeibacter cavernicola]